MVVKCTTNGRDLIPVVVYYRCSSPQQELSVAEQREVVEAYCARKGYRIVREYIDEGKSASKDPEKRTAFNKMILDSKAQDFRVVVTYDAARFTRFDNIEGSTPKQILRSNGVMLDTTKEGEFDWRNPEGRWKDMAYCESNKALSLNISKDALRGRRAVLGLGYWPNGSIPYAFDKSYTDGKETLFKRRHEPFRKGRDWHLRLVANEAEAAIVREIFDLFVNRRWSRRQIAVHLTARGVPPPCSQGGASNGAWDAANVRTVLREKAYVGIASIGGGRRRGAVHNRAEGAERPDACPKVVEPHVWHEAQEVMRQRAEGKARPQPARGGLLSGFVVCGRCGFNMTKRARGNRLKYECASASKRPHLGCRTWSAPEDELLPRVAAWLVEAVDAELLDTLQASPPGEDGRSADEALLAGQVEALEARVKGGAESALLAPPAAREQAWALVKAWQEELEQARQKLGLVQAVRSAPEFADFRLWWEVARTDLIKVREAKLVEWYDPPREAAGGGKVYCRMEAPVYAERDRLRALLARLGVKVKVWFETGTRRRGLPECEFRLKDVQVEASVDLGGLPFEGGRTTTTPVKRLAVKRVFGLADPLPALAI
jgi:DNA invertase Pin-like site-specific DNA recombinase